jgi:hypothetical protein
VKCVVCFAAAPGEPARCPQCGYDNGAPGANDGAAILKAREAFKEQTTAYNPDARVTRSDKLKPWVSLLLGFVFLIFWLRACSSMGWHLW